MDKKSEQRRVLNVFTLAMINVVIIASLRGLPMMAEVGLSSIFFFLVAALVFLVPSALVSAELATAWPKTGGVYVWVKKAFGQGWGFLAIWLQWIQNVIWYPIQLSFIAATLAFIFNPDLANNKIYVLAVILTVYWGSTFINFLGMRASGLVTTIGGMAGTIFPGAFIIILGLSWLLFGDPSQLTFSASKLIPNMGNIENIVFLAGVLLIFAGMEVSAVHAQEVKNPQRNYPRAIFLATIVILIVFILGSLSIAVVVPQAKISLVAGLMQAFSVFLDVFGLKWLIPVIAFFVAAGALSQVSTWIVGPSKGLFATSKDGNLPPFFQHLNRNGMPTNLLIVQGLIVTVLSLIFLFMPTVSSSYWILSALTIQLYLIMYILMYAAALRLRYSEPGVPRAYKIPGGNSGMWVVAGIGIIGALFCIFIGFFPPAQLATGNIIFYETFLISGIAIMCLPPVIIYFLRRPEWTVRLEKK